MKKDRAIFHRERVLCNLETRSIPFHPPRIERNDSHGKFTSNRRIMKFRDLIFNGPFVVPMLRLSENNRL